MEEKNKHIRYYILFDNHTQGMMLHELLDKQGLPNRIAPAPRDTDGKAACGMALLIHPDEPARKPLGGGGQQPEVEVGLGGLLVAELPHVDDDREALLLHLLALAVVVAVEGGQRLGEADEPDREAAVL